MGNLSLTFNFFTMEKNKYLVPSVTGIIGIVIGALIIVGFHTMIWVSPILKPCTNTVPSTEASTFIRGLDASAQNYTDKLKGFTVDIQQYYAMQCLYNLNQGLGGFRIYFTYENSTETASVVVGVLGTGMDDKSLYYSVNNLSPKTAGPCPPACDTY